MKNKYPSLTYKLFAHEPSELAISSVTVFELEYGVRRREWGETMIRKLAMFLAPFSILDFSMNDAIVAGKIRSILEKHGNMISPYDILIAAQAVSRNCTVVTHNYGEFSRVPGLKVEDWFSD